MKIAAELKIKHGVLYDHCLAIGGVAIFAKQIRVGVQTVRGWLNLKRCPKRGVYTRKYTEENERLIESTTGLLIEELFPNELIEFVKIERPSKSVVIQDVSISDLYFLSSKVKVRNIVADPHDNLEKSELQDKVAEIVATLPERWQVVYDCRFNRNMTYDQASKILKLSKERVRQVELQMIRHLQQPTNSNQLKGLFDD